MTYIGLFLFSDLVTWIWNYYKSIVPSSQPCVLSVNLIWILWQFFVLWFFSWPSFLKYSLLTFCKISGWKRPNLPLPFFMITMRNVSFVFHLKKKNSNSYYYLSQSVYHLFKYVHYLSLFIIYLAISVHYLSSYLCSYNQSKSVHCLFKSVYYLPINWSLLIIKACSLSTSLIKSINYLSSYHCSLFI